MGFHRDCTARGSRQYLHGSQCLEVLIGLDLSAAFDSQPRAYYSNGCSPSSALQLHRWPGSSRTSRAGSSLSSWVCISHLPWNSRSAFLRGLCCARASVVRCLLQPGKRCHHRQWCLLPPIHRWHAAPPRHECRQHSCRTVSILAACTADVRHWYLQNDLQLNPDKSEALIVGNVNQLCIADSSSLSVSVDGVDRPVAEDVKVLVIVLDRRLTFHKHVSMVARSCNYHAQAIRHIRYLLSTD